MNAPARIERPELTLPEVEADALRTAYARAHTILEYGSGGSTVMAAEMPGKRVFSVESDKDWVQMMRGWFVQSPPASDTQVDVIWCDVGATRSWGYPVGTGEYLRFPRYPLEVWSLPEFEQPDLVLVDGRFRTGCAMATAFLTRAPVTLLVDDYKRRKHYHAIEDFLGAPALHGRMAQFEVTPMPVPAGRLLEIVEMMIEP